MDKKKREDRAQKLRARKFTSETVIKCTLRSVIADPNNKAAIVDEIANRVTVLSKRTVLASNALNLILKKTFNDVSDSDLPLVRIPDIDPTFMRQLMLGTDGAHKKIQEVQDVLSESAIGRLLDSLERHPGDRNTFSHAATKYVTNFNNHYKVRLSSWIKRFTYSETVEEVTNNIEKKHGIASKDILRWLLFKLHGWPSVVITACKASGKDVEELLPEWLNDSITLQRSILGTTSTINREWLDTKENIPRMVRYLVFINRFVEHHEKEPKLTNIAPLCKVRGHFMTIDTNVLMGILSAVGLVKSQEITLTNKEIWDPVIRTDHLRSEAQGCSFTGTVDTDGVVACIHFKRPKNHLDAARKLGPSSGLLTLQKEAKRRPRDVVVVSNDPGRTNIAFHAWEKEDGTYGSMALSRKAYYAESGVFYARSQSDKWQKSSGLKEGALKELSENSPKKPSLQAFETYLSVLFRHWDSLWGEFLKRRWTDQRLRLYGGKKRCFACFCNRLNAAVGQDKEVIMAYGAAKFAPGGKGEMSVPTARAYKEFSQRFKVALVDEFRSSRVFWKDKETILQYVNYKGTGKRVRGLLWCGSTIRNVSKFFVNRDLNAAINILHCFTMAKRPAILTRSSDKKALKEVVGRFIRK